MRPPLCSPAWERGKDRSCVQGEHTGDTQLLSLTKPARECHTDVQGHIPGNIHLAAVGSAGGGGPERRVRVVQRTAFPTRAGEELRDVRACPWQQSIPCLLTNWVLCHSLCTKACQLT